MFQTKVVVEKRQSDILHPVEFIYKSCCSQDNQTKGSECPSIVMLPMTSWFVFLSKPNSYICRLFRKWDHLVYIYINYFISLLQTLNQFLHNPHEDSGTWTWACMMRSHHLTTSAMAQPLFSDTIFILIPHSFNVYYWTVQGLRRNGSGKHFWGPEPSKPFWIASSDCASCSRRSAAFPPLSISSSLPCSQTAVKSLSWF
jgi:hypothetical protein